MSNTFAAIKDRCAPFLAAGAFAASLTLALSPATAQAQSGTPPAGTPAPSEVKPVTEATSPPNQPIDIKWKLKKLDGAIDLLINADGSYDFSGGFKDKKPGDDWDISLAVKSSTGAVYVFHYEADAADGIQFSKTGDSTILKDDFSTFAHHGWAGVYTFHLNSEGRRKHYEEEERKLEKLRKEEAEARKRHDEQAVAQKKAEERAEAQAEIAWEEAYAREHPGGGGGGGGGIGGVVGGIANTVGNVVSSIGGGVANLVSSIF